MSPLQLAMHKALGGEYHLSDGRVFWMDRLAVDEIMRRLEQFEFRERSEPSDALAFVPEPVSASTIAYRVVQDVCDLPNRNSPDDWPEAMLVTGEELRRIVMDAVERASGGAP